MKNSVLWILCMLGQEILYMIVFLIRGIEWETLFGMIIEGTRVVEFMITRGTGNRFGFVMDFHSFLHFLPEVNSQTMNDTISFCHGTEFTAIKRTFELFGIFRFCL